MVREKVVANLKDNLDLLKNNPVMPLYDLIYQSLRKNIMRGVYKVGERLIEEDISQKAGVSRTPVREAMKRLAAEGLIEFEPKKGAVVIGMDAEVVDFLWDARIYFETKAAEIAATKATDKDKQQLQAIVDEMHVENRTTSNEITDIIDIFNKKIISIANIAQLQRLHNSIDLFAWETMEIMLTDHEKLSDAFLEHVAIANALIANDVRRAGDLTEQHLRKWKAIYMQKYHESAGSSDL